MSPRVFYSLERGVRAFLELLPVVAVGGICCLVLAVLSGVPPFAIVSAIWNGAWGSQVAVATTLTKVTPLLLTGLAVALAYQARLLNIGGEGQLTLGALSAASFAVMAAPLPWPVLLPLTLLAGAVAGGLWALPPVWLRQKRGVHEVISTLLLNYLALYLADYLVLGPLGDGTAMGRTPEIPSEAALSSWLQIGTQGLTAAPLAALVLSLAAQIWLGRTVWGFEVMATGNNPEAARAAGIAADRWQRRMFVLSGALAGLAGALEVLAVHHRFYRAFSPGYGFDGITAAFLVNAAPGWLWLSSLLLASLRAADKWLQLMIGLSPNTILVIQAVLLLAVACHWKRPPKRRQSEDLIVMSWQLLWLALGKATPLLLASLGGLLAESSGVINFALEGMMLAGAFGAMWATFASHSPWVGLLGAMGAGVLIATLHAVASLKLRADQIVSSIALNLLAAGVTGMLLNQLFGVYGTSPAVTRLPDLAQLLDVIFPGQGHGGSASWGRLSVLAPVTLLLGLALLGFFRWTTWGLRLRACGENPDGGPSGRSGCGSHPLPGSLCKRRPGRSRWRLPGHW